MATLIAIALGVLLFAMGLYAAAEYIARGSSVLPAETDTSAPTMEVSNANPTP